MKHREGSNRGEPQIRRKRKGREKHEQQQMEKSIIPGTGTRPDLSDDAGKRNGRQRRDRRSEHRSPGSGEPL